MTRRNALILPAALALGLAVPAVGVARPIDTVPSPTPQVQQSSSSVDAHHSALIARHSVGGPIVSQPPDARDAALAAGSSTVRQSPDARDASAIAGHSVLTPSQSPDARDAARGVSTATAPGVRIVKVDRSSGFDWGDAGIGASVIVGASLLGLGAAVGVRRRSGGPRLATN